MTEAQIAAEATKISAWINAAAIIIVALIGLTGAVYQVKRNKKQKNAPTNSVMQKVKGNKNTVIGIQNNYEHREKNSGKRE